MNLDEIEKQINRSIGQQLDGTEREVGKRFAKTLNEIRAMLSELYEKYSQDGRLSYADMVKYDRLNKFMEKIDTLMTVNYNNVYSAVYRALGWTYQETWDLMTWSIENTAEKELGREVATPETIEAMINNPVKGLTLKETLEKYRTDIIYRIKANVVQGLAKGETYKTMMERLKPALDNDATKAMRIVRTEGHRVQEAAKVEATQTAGKHGVVMTKTWNSSHDERVRHTSDANHRKLDGVTIPVDEDFKQGRGKGKAPGSMGDSSHDINCRCFLTYSVQEVKKPGNYDAVTEFEEWKRR